MEGYRKKKKKKKALRPLIALHRVELERFKREIEKMIEKKNILLNFSQCFLTLYYLLQK